MELKLGEYKIRKGTSFKGHNGLKSIKNHLDQYDDFVRVAIGIGRPDKREGMNVEEMNEKAVSKYVLSKFTLDDL